VKHHRSIVIGLITSALMAVPVVVGASALAEVQPESDTPPASPQPTQAEPNREAEALLAVLKDDAADRTERETAAAKLLAAAGDPTVVEQLAAVLREKGQGSALLIDAIARMPVAPGVLFAPLAERVSSASADELPSLLRAVGSFRTREAVGLLLAHTEAGKASPAERKAALQSLARLSGRVDIGPDRPAWMAWFSAREHLAEPDWLADLVSAMAGRLDTMAAERAALIDRVVSTSRRLYLATPAEQQPALLATYLLDPQQDVCELGLELVSRELAGARSLGPVVAEALVKLLGHSDASIRTSSAKLVSQIAPPDAGAAVSAALNVETDANAAAALLAATARWPTPAARGAIIRWIEAGPPASPFAAEAALQLQRQGMLDDEADRGRVLEALRSADLDALNGSGLRLLAAIGAKQDLVKIAERLGSEKGSTRQSAADALASRPEFLDRILDSARNDPGLFDIALRAITTHRATAAGFAAAMTLPAPSEQAHRAGLLALAGAMPPSELIGAAGQVSEDAALREAILARLVADAEKASDATQAGAIAECMALLAETRLEMGQPDAAIAALDAAPDGLLDPARVSAIRTVALLWLGRIDDAATLNAPASVWLDGLARAIDQPHAAALRDAITTRFANTLTDEQRAQLDTLNKQLAAKEPAKAEEQAKVPETPPS
jgi:hypothetical protein